MSWIRAPAKYGVNLGRKLAAQVRGHATEALLDTYQSERHPVAAAVLEGRLYDRSETAAVWSSTAPNT